MQLIDVILQIGVTELENEVAVLKKKVAVNETARHNADDEVVQLRFSAASQASRFFVSCSCFLACRRTFSCCAASCFSCMVMLPVTRMIPVMNKQKLWIFWFACQWVGAGFLIGTRKLFGRLNCTHMHSPKNVADIFIIDLEAPK
jgi:hypothetical protein